MKLHFGRETAFRPDDGIVTADTIHADMVQVRLLSVQSATNESRINLQFDHGAEPGIWLYDAQGRERISGVMSVRRTPVFSLNDCMENSKVSFFTSETENPMLCLFDNKYEVVQSAYLYMSNSLPGINLHYSTQNEAFSIFIHEKADGVIQLSHAAMTTEVRYPDLIRGVTFVHIPD